MSQSFEEKVIECVISNMLRQLLESYSNLDPMEPPLCLSLSDRELAGAIYEHCYSLADEGARIGAINDLWNTWDSNDDPDGDEYDKKIDTVARDKRDVITNQVLQLLKDVYE